MRRWRGTSPIPPSAPSPRSPASRPGPLPIVEAHRRALLAEHGRQERYGEIPQLADAKIHRRHRVALRVHARSPARQQQHAPRAPAPDSSSGTRSRIIRGGASAGSAVAGQGGEETMQERPGAACSRRSGNTKTGAEHCGSELSGRPRCIIHEAAAALLARVARSLA